MFRIKAFSILMALALAGCAAAVPDIGRLSRAPVGAEFPLLPRYDDPIWSAPQGLPVKVSWLREGRSQVTGGELFILPYVLTKLPYKNIEDVKSWDDHINATFKPDPLWQHRPENRLGHYKCASTSSSTIIDWFYLKAGRPLANYRSWNGGRRERGFDARKIDALYYRFVKTGELGAGFATLSLYKDPVEGNAIPFYPEGFTKIVTLAAQQGFARTAELEAADATIPGLVHKARVSDFLDLKVEQLLHDEPVRHFIADPQPYTQRLVDALDRHGPVFASVRFRFTPAQATSGSGSAGSGTEAVTKVYGDRLPIPTYAGHCVVIIGYVHQNGETFFIYRETFGNFADETEAGGPAYRVLPVHGFAKAFSFHK